MIRTRPVGIAQARLPLNAALSSVSRASGQFRLGRRALEEQSQCVSSDMANRCAGASSSVSGASARAVTTSAASGGAASIRAGMHGRPPPRRRAPPRAGRPPCAGRSRSGGSSGAPMIARTSPGSPAPLPRSDQPRAAPGGQKRQSCALSRMWRRQGSASVLAPTRLIVRCQRRQQVEIGRRSRSSCFT